MAMPAVHPITRIALLQCIVIVIGVFATRTGFMFAGYPDGGVEWRRLPLLVHHLGFLLVLLPLIWTAVCIQLERRGPAFWSNRWMIVSGLLIVILLIVLFIDCSTNPYRGRVPIHILGMGDGLWLVPSAVPAISRSRRSSAHCRRRRRR